MDEFIRMEADLRAASFRERDVNRMELEELRETVAAMRAAQNAFFRGRDQRALLNARRLERIVDRMVDMKPYEELREEVGRSVRQVKPDPVVEEQQHATLPIPDRSTGCDS